MNSYQDFKSKIFKLTAIDLSLYKEKQMKRRIDSLIKRYGALSYSDFVALLERDKSVYDTFINHLTINVSEFYRNTVQWEVLKKEILPMLFAGKSSIKVWSAACSTGEEPYTLVMNLSRFIPLNNIKILATDIDKEAIRKASRGIYNKKSIANVPLDFLNAYFKKRDEDYHVDDAIKRCVTFKQMNLLRDEYPSDFDLIVCRNVMIYFTEEAKKEMYQKFNDSLVKDGILFVGSSEQIIAPRSFNFKVLKTFFYQKM